MLQIMELLYNEIGWRKTSLSEKQNINLSTDRKEVSVKWELLNKRTLI